MSRSLIIVSAFEGEQKVSCFFLLSYSILSTKSNVVTNLNNLNSVNYFLILFLIEDSVSLSCSSGLI